MITRTDRSILGRWWWTVDRLTLMALLTLMVVGGLLSMAASPSVAAHMNLDSFYFVRRHMSLIPLAAAIMLVVSLLQPLQVRRLGVAVFALAVVGMILTLVMGDDIKGAKRWLNLPGFNMQPSEFVKPALVIVTAWMFVAYRKIRGFPGHLYAVAALLGVLVILALQPDFGMIVTIAAVWFIQLFLAGLPFMWVLVGGVAALSAGMSAYYIFPHVAKRIDRFLDPSSGDPYGDRYQINQSLEAFSSGGALGVGPGEGVVKRHIPDVHSDFVFAVAGEEFGLVVCLLLLGLYAFIVFRVIVRVLKANNLFVLLAATGLVAQFGLQAIINIASSIRLLPTKGMTLPLMSYGGSSLLATALGMGMLLSLTRRDYTQVYGRS
jgi:cell division protein FtsW